MRMSVEVSDETRDGLALLQERWVMGRRAAIALMVDRAVRTEAELERLKVARDAAVKDLEYWRALGGTPIDPNERMIRELQVAGRAGSLDPLPPRRRSFLARIRRRTK